MLVLIGFGSLGRGISVEEGASGCGFLGRNWPAPSPHLNLAPLSPDLREEPGFEAKTDKEIPRPVAAVAPQVAPVHSLYSLLQMEAAAEGLAPAAASGQRYAGVHAVAVV